MYAPGDPAELCDNRKEADKYRQEHETARKGLDKERMRSGELEAKLRYSVQKKFHNPCNLSLV